MTAQLPDHLRRIGRRVDLMGRRFGKLVVIGTTSRFGRRYWRCRCDCGGERVTHTSALKRGAKGCKACARKALRDANITHGLAWHPMHTTWQRMMARCYNPKDKNFQRYGARGIRVCERWHSVENFVADLGERPPGMTMDRVNNDGNYEPGNVRWADRKTQASNTRKTRRITFNGETLTVTEWAARIGLRRHALVCRLRRMPAHIALSNGPQPRGSWGMARRWNAVARDTNG